MSESVRVTVAQARGSVPRDAGTSMYIRADGQDGTIGGGALEWEATRIARDMLRDGRARDRRVLPLGPSIGQCCGGSVTLAFETDTDATADPRQSLWIWGAGHVGRAMVDVIAPLPDFALTWIDTDDARFPHSIAPDVTKLVAAAPSHAVSYAPKDALHLILTYSHDMDLDLCDALLRHGFAWTGLIGSDTKWARFRSRLAARGHETMEIDQITCPIGDKSLGKHPQAIAIGVAAALVKQQEPARAKGDI